MKNLFGINGLPINLTGSLRGVPFKVLVQNRIDGKVDAMVYLNKNPGSLLVLITGETNRTKHEIKTLVSSVESVLNWKNEYHSDKDIKQLTDLCSKFVKQISKDVRDHNTGKTKPTTQEYIDQVAKKSTNKPLTKKRLNLLTKQSREIMAKKKSADKKRTAKKTIRHRKNTLPTYVKKRQTASPGYSELHDKFLPALPPGKRRSASGKTYYEYRKNRTDMPCKLTGIKGSKRKPINAIPDFDDPIAAREIDLFINNDGDLYRQSKRPILLNLKKKLDKKTFNEEKAAKLWRYFIDAGMKKYAKEYGGKWFELLSTSDRQKLAEQYAHETLIEYNLNGLI